MLAQLRGLARMFVSRARRRIGGWSALLAAYAFVLNALLATALLAATPPAKSLSGFEICAASADSPPDVVHTDKATKRTAVHCQLCLQSTAPAALPPPATAATSLRVAATIDFGFFAANAPPATRRLSQHPPRGPPHLT
jgi:hypothetical protein